MILKFESNEKENNHYFYVMGWTEDHLKNAATYKKKFDIYDDAVNYFNKISKNCEFVSIFEKIGSKRKWIADTDDMSKL